MRKTVQRRPWDSPASISPKHILGVLIVLRIINALTLRTFFQPDEYFQALEPAWQLAFGADSGAWITWEWRHQLRSSLHPSLFAAFYRLAAAVSGSLSLSPQWHAQVLLSTPKLVQAICAALGDFYSWRLAQAVFGASTHTAWMTLLLTVISPWQWFCSTRTLSNCLEMTLTVAALTRWPWHWSSPLPEDKARNDFRVFICLGLAALACVLRPTNLLLWMAIAVTSVLTWSQRPSLLILLLKQGISASAMILAISMGVDRLFFGFWTFPPFRFLYFNLVQSLAVFYGTNRWDYYLTEGVPLLLTTALPFCLFGFYRALVDQAPEFSNTILRQLAVTCTSVIVMLSLISHKEVRFIYPLLPLLHILAASPAVSFLRRRRILGLIMFSTNILIALLASNYHQSAPLALMDYLRSEYIANSLPSSDTMTIGLLMPCHSTPWRSQLVFPEIRGWALSCEPPVDLNPVQRAAYVDEADQFYAAPAKFLNQTLGPLIRREQPHRKPQWPLLSWLWNISGSSSAQTLMPEHMWNGAAASKGWPQYLAFFEEKEPLLREHLQASAYVPCRRLWNSWAHDDWRRQGDIVVWCIRTR